MGTIRLRPGAIEWREVEGEIVAIDVRTSTYLAANRTAATLWPVLAEGTTSQTLVEVLEDRFGLERERAVSDVNAFVAALREQDLLE
jgi:hypothetical protein